MTESPGARIGALIRQWNIDRRAKDQKYLPTSSFAYLESTRGAVALPDTPEFREEQRVVEGFVHRRIEQTDGSVTLDEILGSIESQRKIALQSAQEQYIADNNTWYRRRNEELGRFYNIEAHPAIPAVFQLLPFLKFGTMEDEPETDFGADKEKKERISNRNAFKGFAGTVESIAVGTSLAAGGPIAYLAASAICAVVDIGAAHNSNPVSKAAMRTVLLQEFKDSFSARHEHHYAGLKESAKTTYHTAMQRLSAPKRP